MSNSSKSMDKKDKKPDQLDFSERLAQAAQALGFQQQRLEPAEPDEEYGIFSSGDHASESFKRVPKPSYKLQEEVALILLKAQEGVYPEQSKKAICSHNGIEEEQISKEYSQKQVDEKLLPLISRDLPEKWNINDVSSAEVARMRRDFLLDT